MENKGGFKAKSAQQKPEGTEVRFAKFGAGDGIRTRDIDLGKVALYQLSYSRAGITELA